MTLRQIETFYWCATLGSFTAAAVRLRTTQPSVSARIRDLEAALNVRLFSRVGRSARLTPGGHDLLPVAEDLLRVGDRLSERLESARAAHGLVRIGAADTIALTWLPDLLSQLAERHPQLNVELIVDLSVRLQERLRTGEIDIGFLVDGLPGPAFERCDVGAIDNAWIASPALAAAAGPSCAELARLPILTHTPGSHLYAAVLAWFDEEQARPTVIRSCNSLSTLLQLTIAGVGISVLPPKLVAADIADRRLAVIATRRRLPQTRFVACWPARRPLGLGRSAIELARTLAARDPRFG